MAYLDKLIIFLFSLSLTTPLYASLLGVLNLNILVTLIYAVGLLSYISFNINKLRFSFLDLLIIFFCLFFIFSISYTLNANYMTNFLLFFILPLYYFSGKITKIKESSSHIFLLFILLTFLVDIYVLIKLTENNFIYHTYYHYSNSMLKLDYLTMSQYSFISLVLLLFNKNFKINFFSNKIIFFTFLSFFILMIFISGSRFTILFTLVFLLWYIFKNASKSNLIKLIIISFLSLFIILNYLNTNTLFQYTITRFDSATKEDNSINERKIMIEKALSKIDENPLFGYGINSTENILNVKYVHNMFLETFLETGIFNFLLLSFIVLYVLFISIKTKNYPITILYIYLVLSYSKSFTISEAKILFFVMGYIIINKSIENLKNAN